MSNSVRPHRRQPTRLPRPWDSPGKNTGVGCHFLLQCMKVKSEREVAQLCLTLSDPMDYSPPGSSTHGIFQARLTALTASIISLILKPKMDICPCFPTARPMRVPPFSSPVSLTYVLSCLPPALALSHSFTGLSCQGLSGLLFLGEDVL